MKMEGHDRHINQEKIPLRESVSDTKRRERSPATDRKLSDRASEYALIQYLSTLAKNKKTVKTFDFSFVEYLLENGADINNCDITGQSAFHIVSKFWNVDVARFLLDNGAGINAQDYLGRSPLHEAAALNYVDMVEFLLQNGADLDIQTFEQEQRPIHFAGKNDSTESLRILLAYGADINSLDSKNRTPLQVAAEMNRANVTEMLINEGASAVIYDTDGNSSLTLLAEKLPNIALMALDQLHSVDRVKRKEYFSLNYLEGTRVNIDNGTAPRTLLEIAVRRRRYYIVMHPVVQEWIDVKWNYYGRRGAVWGLLVNLVYVILWTIFSFVLSSKSSHIYSPVNENGWKIAIVLCIAAIAAAEIRKNFKGTMLVRRQEKARIEWRAQSLEQDLAFCHPRCPEEWNYLSNQIKSVRNHSYLSSVGDGWIYIDWLTLVLIITTFISHMIFLGRDQTSAYKTHSVILISLLLVLWLRMAKYARPFRFTGPIVVIFSHIVKDIGKCSFLFAILFIPYASAFWLTFGSNSPHPVEGYDNVFALLYNMLCMVVGIDFPFDDILSVNPFMARILCSSFIISSAIVVVNLLIALLSDTFTRLYSNAVANAMMQRAQSVVITARSLGTRRERDYYKYVRDNCSPLVKSLDRDTQEEPQISNLDELTKEIKKINTAISKLQGGSSVKTEVGSKTDVETLKYTLKQLLKQNHENAAKIGKIYTKLIIDKERKQTYNPVQRPQRRRINTRRGSVMSTMSVKTEVIGCFEMNDVIPEFPFHNDAIFTECNETRELALLKNPSVSHQMNANSPIFTTRTRKRTRFEFFGEENAGYDNSDDEDERPCGSRSREIQQRKFSRSSVTIRRSSTFATSNVHAVPQRIMNIDRRSSDGSISL